MTVLSVFFSRALADRLAFNTPLVTTAVDPGFCRSELGRSVVGLRDKIAFWLMNRLLARTAEEGSRQLLYAALGPDGKEGDHVNTLKGTYMYSGAATEPSDYVLSKVGKETQDRIWVSDFLVLWRFMSR